MPPPGGTGIVIGGTGGTSGTGAGTAGEGNGAGLGMGGTSGGEAEGVPGGVPGWARGGSGVDGWGAGVFVGRGGIASGNVEGGGTLLLPGTCPGVLGGMGSLSAGRPLGREPTVPGGSAKPGAGGTLSGELSFFEPPNSRWNKPGRLSVSVPLVFGSLLGSALLERNKFSRGRFERLDFSLLLVGAVVDGGGDAGEGIPPGLGLLSLLLGF
jgi:hypothetical protein